MRCETILGFSMAVAVGMFGATVGAAQEATSTTSPAVSPEFGLTEIVVTAQRREESLQDAAIAITAVGADDLVRAGVSDVSQLTSVAPALQISTFGGSYTKFYLRGVGNFTTNTLSDSAVSVNLDGVVIARSSAVQGMFYDLERVEVLKGPQGTLYGRNATGGAVNVITAKPRLRETGGHATVEIGHYGAVKYTGALNAPMGDTAAVRVAAYSSGRDGYLSDGTSDDETRAVRAQLLVEPSEHVSLTAGADYAHVGGRGEGATVVGLDRGERIGRQDSRATPLIESAFAFLPGDFLEQRVPGTYLDNGYWGVYAQADVETPAGSLTVLPAYRDTQLDFLACTAQCFLDNTDARQFTFEARLASDDTSRLDYLLGVYYLNEDIDERANYNQQYVAFHVNFLSETASYAAFARLGFDVTDSFRLTGGVRFTADNKSANTDSVGGIVVCPSMLTPAPSPCPGTPILPIQLSAPSFLVDATGAPVPVQPWGTGGAILTGNRTTAAPEETFEKLTYRVGMEYDVTPDSLLYATFETGFKSGGFFVSIDDPTFEPETIDAYTLGSKNRFLNDHLQLNLEGFWWTYKNQQVAHFSSNTLGGVEFITENVGKTELRGIEVEAQGAIGSGTMLRGTVQYLDAETKSFTYTTPANAGAPVTGCPFALSGGVYLVDCSGRRAVSAPEWTVTAGVEQAFDLRDDSRIVLSADARYQSEYFTNFEQLPGQLEDGYTIANLQLQYERAGFSIAAFANNVTDEHVAADIQPHPRTPQLLMAVLRPPRTYGLRLDYRF